MAETSLNALPADLGLPDFPWDTLAEAKSVAGQHPGGLVDLSVGTPVDPTPPALQQALRDAADAPGYPLVVGTEEVRDAIGEWMDRRAMVQVEGAGRIPTIGSKEMVAWLPLMLGVKPGQKVLIPKTAYPTYEVGAVLAGAEPVTVDPTDTKLWPDDAAMVWLNSPSNPTGAVMTVEQLATVVTWARQRGCVVASDECYAELGWAEPFLQGAPSLLDPRVCGDDPTGLLVLYSLSKQSNLAGYRAGLLVGDPRLVESVVEVRKHTGMMVPAPVQAALVAALTDDTHVSAQRAIYARRREILEAAVVDAGLELSPMTQAGLYLWVRGPVGSDGRRPSGRELVDWFAARGILVAPGDFYGAESNEYVRVALTATDEHIAQAAVRLGER